MPDFTVKLSDDQARGIDLLASESGLDPAAFVQHFVVRTAEGKVAQARQRAKEVALAMTDQEFDDLPRQRKEAKDAAVAEAQRLATEAAPGGVTQGEKTP